jgi:uncharacterized protein (TIGR02271 family)
MKKSSAKDNVASRTRRATGTGPAACEVKAEVRSNEVRQREASVTRRDQPGEEREVVVPVVEEEVRVGKRTIETGRVRVTKVVHEREEVIDQPLFKTNVVVQRVPVNQYVEQAPTVREEGDTLIIPMVEEVIVVQKRLLVREELRITKQQVETHEPQRVTVRREEVRIDRVKGGQEADDGMGVAKSARSRRA